MCKDWKEDKEKMLKNKLFPTIYQQAMERLRKENVDTRVPGYLLFVYAICAKRILDYDEDLFIFL